MRADERPYLVIELEQLEDAGRAAVSAAAAALAADRVVHDLSSLEADHAVARVELQVGDGKLVRDLASVAQQSDQTLGDHGPQRRFEQEAFDPQIKEPRHRG